MVVEISATITSADRARAIKALTEGKPLATVINDLTEILESSIIESYRSGLSLAQCAEIYQIERNKVGRIIHRREPLLIRPKTRHTTKKR